MAQIVLGIPMHIHDIPELKKKMKKLSDFVVYIFVKFIFRMKRKLAIDVVQTYLKSKVFW